MKKLLALFLSLIMLISLSSCGGNVNGSDNNAGGNDNSNGEVEDTDQDNGSTDVGGEVDNNQDNNVGTEDTDQDNGSTDIGGEVDNNPDDNVGAEDGEGDENESEASCGNGLKFTLNSDSVSYSVTGIGTCTDADIVIPSIYEGLPVTAVGNKAFYEKSNITSVVIPDSVTSIGDFAFSHCTSLKGVVIGDGVTSIGHYAFSNCIRLTSVEIGDSVTSIGNLAFYDCVSLTSVVIGDSVTSIGNLAFEICTSLTSITVDENNANYKSIAGNLYSKDGKTLIQYAIGKIDTSFEIPDSVMTIGLYAFSDCTSLTSVVIPDSVTSIDIGAFSFCTGLTRIVIGDGVTIIGDSAFFNCTSLVSVVIGESVTSIGLVAFKDCFKLVEVINHSTLSITKQDESNGHIAFYAYETHTGESKIIEYEDYLFYTNYNGVNYLLGYTGADKEITLPISYNGEQYVIYKYAFYERDDITSVVVSDSVKSIGDYAFSHCIGLVSIVIGNSVKSIGVGAFSNCYKLVEVINHSTLNIVRSGESNGGVAYYAKEVHSGESKIVKYEDYLFYNYYGHYNYLLGYIGTDKDIILPQSYNGEQYVIYDYAFYKRDDITSIVIPESVEQIYSCAFIDCIGIADVYYMGTEEEWNVIYVSKDNDDLTYADRYYYSETEPTDKDYTYWHYVDGEIVVW